MGQVEVLRILHALGGRASSPEIHSFARRTMPRWPFDPCTVNTALRHLARNGKVRRLPQLGPNRASVWELVR